MPKSRRLVIDIGTNSVLALLADVDGDNLTVVFDKKKTTRLGEGLASSRSLTNAAMKRTAGAVLEFAHAAQYDTAVLLGTEALRLAGNADQFAETLASALDLRLVVLSGPKEAELSFLGSLHGLTIDRKSVLVVDVGGGSTELVMSADGEIKDSTSIPLGALKLRELSTTDSLAGYEVVARAFVEMETKYFAVEAATVIVATGGTITSVAAIISGQKDYDGLAIHGMALSTSKLREIAEILQQRDREGRESLIPFDVERADLILPGLGIFLSILGIIQKDSLVVSSGGLRFGAALYPQKIWT